MSLFMKIHLYGKLYVTGVVTDDGFWLSDETCSTALGLEDRNSDNPLTYDEITFPKKCLKITTNASFLYPFANLCSQSQEYRMNVVQTICENFRGTVAFLKLILEPPDQEIIDYTWNHKLLRLVWMKAEIDNAYSWLSTLGGAYSALGDYFEECAEEAGRISVRQYKLSKLLGDESLAARSKLYSALSFSQKGKLKLSRHIVREIDTFARNTKDRRLHRMCQGVWAKLKYLRSLKRGEMRKDEGDASVNGKCV